MSSQLGPHQLFPRRRPLRLYPAVACGCYSRQTRESNREGSPTRSRSLGGLVSVGQPSCSPQASFAQLEEPKQCVQVAAVGRNLDEIDARAVSQLSQGLG